MGIGVVNVERRLRVLLVTGAYYPEISAGGLQSRAIAQRLRTSVRFSVLTTATDPALPARDRVDDADVSRVLIDVRSGWSRALAALRLTGALLRIVPGVDLIHVQGYSSKNVLVAAVAKLFRRKVLVHLQTARHDEPATIAAYGKLAWWAFSTADRYLSVSPGLADKYLEAGLRADRLSIVPNGVDGDRFSPASPEDRSAIRRRLGLPVDGRIVLFVGVLSHDKQPHVLLEAWRRLQESGGPCSTLVLIGSSRPSQFEADANLAARLRLDAAAAGLSDRLVIVEPTNEIESYFRAADVYVMPSLREGLPIALLEAMSCGLPTVASRLRGASDAIIDDGANGRLVPVGDVDAFAGAIRDVLSDRAAAAAMGVAARRTVEQHYTLSRVAQQWLDAYRTAAGLVARS